MRIANIIVLLAIYVGAFAQNKTDASLFLRADSLQIDQVSSESGDLYKKLGHHGAAIENEWMAVRFYFSNKAALDPYSKKKPGLELKKYLWYPNLEEQKAGAGADYYKVGQTVGLGGVRLWDGKEIVRLDPVSLRTESVVKEGSVSYAEMLSEDVPYMGKKVDILVRVTAYSGIRQMKVEAWALTDDDVQFVTGVNYHPGQEVVEKDNYVITWGQHPEDVTSGKTNVGAAVIIDRKNYVKRIDDGSEIVFVTKKTKYTSHWITSTIELDETMNSLKKLTAHVEDIANK